VNGLVTLVGRVEDAGAVALVEFSEDGKTFREVSRQRLFRFDVNLSKLGEGKADALQFRSTDAAGNSSLMHPPLTLNLAADQPVAQIQLPADGEVIRDDFVLSGMAFDDDGVAAILYRIDGGDFQRLPGGNSYTVPISLDLVADNAHTVEVKTEDIGGLVSEVVKSTFTVSKSDPVSALESPGIGDQLRDIVELKGNSKDPNGIADVGISFDNGLSFYLAEGKETWRYRLDTRLLADGTQAVLVKAVDTTGAEGLYTTTINVDNTPPVLVIDSPLDGEIFTDAVHLNGRSFDNIGLAALVVTVDPISAPAGTASKKQEATLTTAGILLQDLDLKDLPPGRYNVQFEASDGAGTHTIVSRNVVKRAGLEAERVDPFFPSDGSALPARSP
jgi:hypothetical protein